MNEMKRNLDISGIIFLILIAVSAIGFVGWIWNATKLASCDFKADYKCEVIHVAD
jgi:hypothetical protein